MFCLVLTGLVGLAGLLLSLDGALVWCWADIASGHSYTHSLLPVWNALIRLSFFVIITWLVAALRQASERDLARIFSLTGAVNSRFFYVLAQRELDRLLEEMRSHRWPITFSVGVLTCSAAPQTIDQLVKLADDLMDAVKRDGKNAIRYDSYAG